MDKANMNAQIMLYAVIVVEENHLLRITRQAETKSVYADQDLSTNTVV